MKLAAAQANEPPRPAHTITLRPEEFSSRWKRRPMGEVAIGIRPLSERESMTASAEAHKATQKASDSGDAPLPPAAYAERYNDECACHALQYVLTDPNDAEKAYFAGGVDEIRIALPPRTIARLLDELEIAIVAASPLRPEATADDLARLRERLADETAIAALPRPKARRVRQWLRFCLDEIDGA